MLYNYAAHPNVHDNTAPKQLSETPTIHKDCNIINSQLGSWTEIGERNYLQEVIFEDYSYTDNDVHMMYTHVGKFTSIARQVRINPSNHPYWRVTQHHCTYRRQQYGFAKADDEQIFAWRRQHGCQVGHDVWLGHGVIIMPGVSIGNVAIIGSGAVVTKDVGAYEIAVGIPAKVIKKRFSKDIIEKLQQIKWWDWNRKTLIERFDELNDIEFFVKQYA